MPQAVRAFPDLFRLPARAATVTSTVSPSDADLMARVARGDALAFRLLAGRHMAKGHAIAFRITHNREDAEEAVQDGLSKVWRNAARFDAGRAAFSTWFYSIIVRCALDRMRRRPPDAADIDDLAEQLADAKEGSDAAWMRGFEARRIATAVAALPEQQKTAVVLCYYEDFTQPEAARIMSLNLKQVEGLLCRARKALKASLGDV
ncbi:MULTISPECIES: sigma-70 family RNA polymerase sigma factor [Asticcacaulis]|uniref:sigma-70 family RNA polymerase sigma factor n=1 Tax=Asticcacaulis TaxID=76890 RepID=UPI001AE11BA5|nr:MULTISPECIES: sigma-70 family RNA polymerase sigma factor [Asticcacaulis]MBP2160866.1 RNA polymerase sigma-70 factor (ECF subfamily) [Asticcacaulis solisilvae]MDR6801930.1 RNA polymerase sigma-70 factor (ECF subfamily) [Asticcacaulis sp. BE141]